MRTTTAAMLAVLTAGCVVGEGRQTVYVPTTVGATEPAEVVVLDDGTEVTLEVATVEVTDLLLEGPPPELAALWHAMPGVAWAHPGHDPVGSVVGQMYGTLEVDLLAEPAPWGDAELLSGEVATARLGVVHAWLEGTALRPDGTEVPFALGGLVEQPVSGLPVDRTIDADAPPEVLSLTFDPARALAEIDFTADEDGDGWITADDLGAANALVFGVLGTSTWTLQVHPDPTTSDEGDSP